MGTDIRTNIALDAVFRYPVWHTHCHVPLFKFCRAGRDCPACIVHKSGNRKFISFKRIDGALNLIDIVCNGLCPAFCLFA